MGQLVDGVWKDEWYDTDSTGGEFKRDTAKFRNWVTSDGQAGPTGDGGFAAVTPRRSPSGEPRPDGWWAVRR